jgi:hypothetical protein
MATMSFGGTDVLMGLAFDSELGGVVVEDGAGGLDELGPEFGRLLEGAGEREHGCAREQANEQFTDAELMLGVQRSEMIDHREVELAKFLKFLRTRYPDRGPGKWGQWVLLP